MVALEVNPQGVILPIKAQPGGRRNGLTGVHDGALKLSVTQAPEKGKANVAIAKLLCTTLGLKMSQIELIQGETSSHKRFLIRNIPETELLARINTALKQFEEI